MWLLLAASLWALIVMVVLALLYAHGEGRPPRADGEFVQPRR